MQRKRKKMREEKKLWIKNERSGLQIKKEIKRKGSELKKRPDAKLRKNWNR